MFLPAPSVMSYGRAAVQNVAVVCVTAEWKLCWLSEPGGLEPIPGATATKGAAQTSILACSRDIMATWSDLERKDGEVSLASLVSREDQSHPPFSASPDV